MEKISVAPAQMKEEDVDQIVRRSNISRGQR
jgi:hypothetical protein